MAIKTIDEKILMEERESLEQDYKNTEERIKLIETELGKMRSNLNAIYGAIQEVDKLIIMTKEGHKSKSRQEADKASEVA